MAQYNDEITQKRIKWFHSMSGKAVTEGNNLVAKAYEYLLKKLEILKEQAPIVESNSRKIVFHSKNTCPTLEACKILGLDTRKVCKLYNEGATEVLLQQLDPRLHFSRNYEKLRPHTDYCEEIITLRDE